jgi:hypothetical protein
MSDNGIGNEIAMINFESSEVVCENNCFFEQFCQCFDNFVISKSLIFEYFDSSLNFLDISNFDFLFLLKNEIVVSNVDCQMKTLECSILRIEFFCELNCFDEMKDDLISIMRINDSDFFVNEKERETNENILGCDQENENENENEMTEDKMSFIRQILRLSGGSTGHTSFRMTSDNCVEIADSVKIIEKKDLIGLESLNEVHFSSGNHLIEIDGFEECPSLCRIDIPSSVKKIGSCGFHCCRSLNIITFSSNSHLRDICGFSGCTSLCRIEIPSSVEIIRSNGFNDCTSLNDVTFSSNSHLRHI